MTSIPLMTSGLTPTTLTACSYPPALIGGTFVPDREPGHNGVLAHRPTHETNTKTQGVIDRA